MNLMQVAPIEATEVGPAITVLFSTERPSANTNPYLTQLYSSLPDAVQLRYFSMRQALFSSYDVLHLHWPEYLLRHPSRVGTWAKQACMAVVLLRVWATGTPIVRTLHNLAPHEERGWGERMLLKWIDRLTKRWIRINATTPVRPPFTDTILHGHYRDWYASMQRDRVVSGRLLYFGLIRPYKGVESLLAAMNTVDDPDTSLRIVGKPANPEMRDTIDAACQRDGRISGVLTYVEEPVLVQEFSQAELVVLPYRQMHNSGTLLLALSLARPVLAPRSDANVAIADEVGQGWVYLFDGELDGRTLDKALAQVRSMPRSERPDLSQRDWGRIGKAHYRTYLEALGRDGDLIG